MIANINGRANTNIQEYSYFKVKNTLNMIQCILEDKLYLSDDIANALCLYEKVGAKFVKPVNQASNALYVYIGGWRLIHQDKAKTYLENPQLYGVNLALSSKLYAPSNNALYVVKTPEGVPVAEMIDSKVVNILFDVFSIIKEDREVILYNIFKDIVENFFQYDVEKEKQRIEEKKKNAVSDFLIGIASKKFEETQRKVDEVDSNIASLERRLRDNLNRRRELMALAEGCRIQAQNNISKMNEEINSVRSLSKVDDITISPEMRSLIIRTNKIYVQNAGRTYYIGIFDIYINVYNCNVEFENLDNCRRSYWGNKCHHPHVDEKGHACWGNVGRAIMTYIQEAEYQALASLLIGFLESVNTADVAGKNITSWDVVNSKGEVIQNGYDYRYPPADINLYTCYECQEQFSRDNIAMSKGDMHICRHCADLYFTCTDCGDIISQEDAEHCDRCGCSMCEDCHDDSEICNQCVQAAKVVEALSTPGAVLCQYCNTVIDENDLHTCETCGEQGCSNCITFDGRYSCPNHR